MDEQVLGLLGWPEIFGITVVVWIPAFFVAVVVFLSRRKVRRRGQPHWLPRAADSP